MTREKHTNTQIPGCGFHHIAIRTSDWDKSLHFWQEGMGFKLAIQWNEPPRRGCMLDTGDGNYLEIFERDPLPEGQSAPVSTEEPNILHLCFRADDVDAAVAKAVAAGAEVTVEPKYPEPFAKIGLKAKIAFIKGPDGELCEFFESDRL